MSNLFLDEIRAAAVRVCAAAGQDQTKLTEAARKELNELVVSGAARHELAIKGLAAEAANITSLVRAGKMNADGTLKSEDIRVLTPVQPGTYVPTHISGGVTVGLYEPQHFALVDVDVADTYFASAQKQDADGRQRYLCDFSVKDFAADRERALNSAAGSTRLAEADAEVIRLMQDEGVDVLGKLTEQGRQIAFRSLRQD
jgi:hypothetical protein